MNTENFKLESSTDGLMLDGIMVVPEEIKGVLQLVHGMCENKERYLDFMNFMAENGYACIIHDNRGHGKSIKAEGDLGYMYEGRAAGLIDDAHDVTRFAKAKFGENVPYYLFGHSMGSLIVRCYISKYDKEIDKLIVCGSPSNRGGTGAGKAILGLLTFLFGDKSHNKLMDGLMMGGYDKVFAAEGNPNSWICSNVEVVKAYNESPLCGFSFSLNGYKALLDLMVMTYGQSTYSNVKQELPIRFFSGAEDPCAADAKSFNDAVIFLRTVGYKNVEGHMYPGMRHEILNETDKKQVYEDMLSFLNA